MSQAICWRCISNHDHRHEVAVDMSITVGVTSILMLMGAWLIWRRSQQRPTTVLLCMPLFAPVWLVVSVVVQNGRTQATDQYLRDICVDAYSDDPNTTFSCGSGILVIKAGRVDSEEGVGIARVDRQCDIYLELLWMKRNIVGAYFQGFGGGFLHLRECIIQRVLNVLAGLFECKRRSYSVILIVSWGLYHRNRGYYISYT